MITVVYGTLNGTQDSIGWWLCQQEGIGPQAYKAPFMKHKWEGFPGAYSGLVIDDDRIEPHVECHRRMENIRGDIIAPMRPLEKDYKMLLWSNYFGCLTHADQKIECDKLIICDADPLEDCFHYIVTHSCKPITHHKIEEDSEVWWTDHKLLGGIDDGEILDSWKDVWYEKYHQAMHDAFDNGTLKYMWQLNLLHWDVNDHLFENGPEPELIPHDDFKSLIKRKVFEMDNNTAIETYKHNPDALYVRDPFWFKQADRIADYLELDIDVHSDPNLIAYKEAYWERRDWFNQMLKDI